MFCRSNIICLVFLNRKTLSDKNATLFTKLDSGSFVAGFSRPNSMFPYVCWLVMTAQWSNSSLILAGLTVWVQLPPLAMAERKRQRECFPKQQWRLWLGKPQPRNGHKSINLLQTRPRINLIKLYFALFTLLNQTALAFVTWVSLQTSQIFAGEQVAWLGGAPGSVIL